MCSPTGEEGIDRYHLLERLADALEIVEPDGAERSRLLNHWNERLDLQDSAIDVIERYFETRYLDLSVEKQKQLWEHLVYLSNNKDRLRYVTLATSGLPIGSGVTESAAKTCHHRSRWEPLSPISPVARAPAGGTETDECLRATA